jgi:hypothetical protein
MPDRIHQDLILRPPIGRNKSATRTPNACLLKKSGTFALEQSLGRYELFIWGQYGDMGKYPPEVEPGRYPLRLRQR